MADTVYMEDQKGNPMIARAILRVGPPAERGGERQAQSEIGIDLGRLLLGAQLRDGRQDSGGPPAGRAATARVGLSRHGALLYSTLPPPATDDLIGAVLCYDALGRWLAG